MQTYNADFAEVYDKYWGGFAEQVAPRFLHMLGDLHLLDSTKNLTIVDLCCGTGQLARKLLDAGHKVIGIDISASMLAYAEKNNVYYVNKGLAEFHEQPAQTFAIGARADVVISLYDALNHLADPDELRQTFAACFRATGDRGILCFDLNTKKGLMRWNAITVEESDDLCLIVRGLFDEAETRAYTRISGFRLVQPGLYKRFAQTAYNTVFYMSDVKTALEESGWSDVTFRTFEDFMKEAADPEQESRIFVVARK